MKTAYTYPLKHKCIYSRLCNFRKDIETLAEELDKLDGRVFDLLCDMRDKVFNPKVYAAIVYYNSVTNSYNIQVDPYPNDSSKDSFAGDFTNWATGKGISPELAAAEAIENLASIADRVAMDAETAEL